MRTRIRITATGNEFQICVAYDHYCTTGSFSKNTHKNLIFYKSTMTFRGKYCDL
jgi:hypothetical protein